jgi:hypothetical protein
LVTRAEWGAEPAVGWPIEHEPVRAIVIHHTGTRNDEPEPFRMLQRVQRFHAHERGWGDIGYSFVVLADGHVAEGRDGSATAPAPLGVVAGHALGHNPGTIGVAVQGRFHDHGPNGAALDALIDLVTTIVRSCDLDPEGGPVDLTNGARLPAVICAHRDARDTSCPGDALMAALGPIRRAVARSLASP